MKVLPSSLLLASLIATTVFGVFSSPIDDLKVGTILECNKRKFEVADSIYLKNSVCVRGVNEIFEASESTHSSPGVNPNVDTTHIQSHPPGSHSTETDHEDCYSIPTLYVVKVAPKEVIAAEMKVLSAFGPSNDFAELVGYGHIPDSDDLDFYISTRYGPNLRRVVDEFDNKLSVGTILGIAADMMDHFKVLHNHKPPHVWRKFDLSNICLAGKAGAKHKVYLAGFRSIGQLEDHEKHTQLSTGNVTPSKGNLDTKHSAVNDIKALANVLVYLSREDYMPMSVFQKRNPELAGKKLLEHWIGSNSRDLLPFIEAAYGLQSGHSIDHEHLKGLLPKQPRSWDWETKKWIFA